MAFTTLSDIANAIAADAGANPATHPQTAYTTIGSVERGKRVGPPSVTWVPRGGPVEFATEDDPLAKNAFDRRLTCDVFFVGVDYDQAELEAKAFLGGFARELPRLGRALNEEHAEQSLTGANRYEIKLTVEVRLSVHHEEYTTATIDTFNGTVTVGP